MSTVVNLLKVGPNTIKPDYKTHRRAISIPEQPKKGYTKQDEMTDEEFIEHMKANPKLWGNRVAKNNAYPMRKGWVIVYRRDGEFSTSYYFASHYQKMERIKEALRSIRNLPGSFIEISYEQ